MPILGACENVRPFLHRVFRGERHVRRPGLPRMDVDRDNKVDGCLVRSADCKWRLNHFTYLGPLILGARTSSKSVQVANVAGSIYSQPGLPPALSTVVEWAVATSHAILVSRIGRSDGHTYSPAQKAILTISLTSRP